jgi:hypothetical protein
MKNPDHISESLATIFWIKILKFFDEDPRSGMEKIQIRDPGGMEKIQVRDPGKTSRIRNTGLDGKVLHICVWHT